MNGAFPSIQAVYAKHHVATYPLTANKTPVIRNYSRVGARYSRQLGIKFPDATAAGFVAGAHNKIIVVDIDSPDERLVAEIQKRFGVTPLQVVTPSGGRHLYYRFNGETRQIRPLPDVDILGAGNVVAAMSVVPKGKYTIERGSLDDLARLPKLQDTQAPQQPRAVIAEGQRNNELFKYCRKTANSCDTVDQLVDAANYWAEEKFATPLPSAEILKTCHSAWTYRDGRKQVMWHVLDGHIYERLKRDPLVLALFTVLSAENGPNAEFMVADAFAPANGWPRRMVPDCRKKLIEMGLIIRTRPSKKGAAALYRWGLPR